MKTYLKRYTTTDVKGYLDVNDEGEYFISYENGEDTVHIMVEDLLKEMVSCPVQFKTIAE